MHHDSSVPQSNASYVVTSAYERYALSMHVCIICNALDIVQAVTNARQVVSAGHLCSASMASLSGEYVIDVYYYGKPIQGSPFRVHAFDWNKITLKNLPGSGMVGKTCEFDSESRARSAL